MRNFLAIFILLLFIGADIWTGCMAHISTTSNDAGWGLFCGALTICTIFWISVLYEKYID